MKAQWTGCIMAVLVIASSAARPQANGAPMTSDSQIQAQLAKALDRKQLRGVTANVQNGVVKLAGTVSLYADKQDAEKRVHKLRDIASIEDRIVVDGAEVDDATLRAKLSDKIMYDRSGYGTQIFNSFTLAVQNGAVTLGGVACKPEDKDSALSLVANYPGVKDLVDHVQVAPVSSMDDRLRLALAQAVYGATTLNRYALDPAKPIRITVINGNVTLTGAVDSEMDRNVANLRANGVSGVFKVTNLLQVTQNASTR